MKLIEKLSAMVDEEIEDAKKYAKCALKYKDERPALAKTFFDLSGEEMRHMSMLHAEVEAVIQKYRQEHGEPPTAMLAVYDYLHGKQIEKAKEVKDYQAMYRG
nr:MAG TPA: NEUTROPHIL-ACTIVATING PROTEIN A, four-helix bundle, METAL TRANSPORT [Caudoviricetes sp.]